MRNHGGSSGHEKYILKEVLTRLADGLLGIRERIKDNS